MSSKIGNALTQLSKKKDKKKPRNKQTKKPSIMNKKGLSQQIIQIILETGENNIKFSASKMECLYLAKTNSRRNGNHK